jgi:L-aminopeptidase/D-esterase-like protein
VRVPIVLGAVIDDLSLGDGRIRPNPDAAIKACEAASADPVAEGSVGAGAGATVGKIFRSRGLPGMKGGIGTASLRRGEVVVAALAVVNAAGDIVDPASGAIVAGALKADGSGFARSRDLLIEDLGRSQALAIDDEPFRATTLTVIATNVALGKTSLTKLAMMANTGAARAVDPYHTNGDGDQVIALSTNRVTPRRPLAHARRRCGRRGGGTCDRARRADREEASGLAGAGGRVGWWMVNGGWRRMRASGAGTRAVAALYAPTLTRLPDHRV